MKLDPKTLLLLQMAGSMLLTAVTAYLLGRADEREHQEKKRNEIEAVPGWEAIRARRAIRDMFSSAFTAMAEEADRQREP